MSKDHSKVQDIERAERIRVTTPKISPRLPLHYAKGAEATTGYNSTEGLSQEPMLPVLETGTGERIDRPPQGASPTEPISKATEHEGGPILAATSAEALSGWHGTKARFEKKDQAYLNGFDDEINGLLVFAGLFSAILTAFIIEISKTLQEDYTETSANLLRRLSLQMANASLAEAPLPPTQFHSSPIVKAVNVLWFMSLLLSVFAALFGIFVKQWLHTYRNWSDIGDPRDAVLVRHWYRRGMAKWRIPDIMATLPLLLQMALACFIIGLVTYLWSLDYVVASFATFLAVLGTSTAAVVVVLPFWYPSCPYKSPLGLALLRTLRSNRIPHWRNYDLAAVKAEWALIKPSSPESVFKEMCVLLELAPEADELSNNQKLVKARVNELEVYPDDSSFRLLCFLVALYSQTIPRTFKQETLGSISYVLEALSRGAKYSMPNEVVDGLVQQVKYTTPKSKLAKDLQEYLGWLYMLAGCISHQGDLQNSPALREKVLPIIDCIQQWNVCAGSNRKAPTISSSITVRDREWFILYDKLRRMPTRVISLSSPILAMALSPTSFQFVTGHEDGNMFLVSGDTGAALLEFELVHSARILCIKFVPSCNQVITGSKDSTVCIWDIKTGKCLKTFRGHNSRVNSIAVSPEGTRLVSVSDDSTLRWWDLNTGEILFCARDEHNSTLDSVSWSPDGAYIAASASSNIIYIWDARTAVQLRELRGHADRISSVAISFDNQRLVSGSFDSTARIWNTMSGACLLTLRMENSGTIRRVSFSPDAKLVVTGGGDREARMWDANAGTCLKVWTVHSDIIDFVGFTSDGLHVISGARDSTIRILDARPAVRCTSLSLRTFHDIQGACWCLSEDGTLLVSGLMNGTLQTWDTNSGKLQQELGGHASSITCVSLSRDGSRLISASHDGCAKIWNTQEIGALHVLEGHHRSILSVVFSNDGSLAASGAEDHSVRIWNANTGKCLHILRGHNAAVQCVAFADMCDLVAAGSRSGCICLWDRTSGQHLQTLHGHVGWVRSIAFSPDNLHLVSGSDDWSVRIWNTETGSCVKVLEGGGYWALHVAYSSDGMCVMSRDQRGEWRTWHAPHDFPSPATRAAALKPLITLERDGWITGRKHSQDVKQRLYWLIPERHGQMYVRGHHVFIDASRHSKTAFGYQNTGITTLLDFSGCI